MTDGIVCGISGWFTPHGVRYHEDRRRIEEIAAEDWTALLAHADTIGFFTRPQPAPAPPEARIYHLQITANGRTRELAINDPFESPELAKIVSLTRRCLRDRRVLTSETMTDDDVARLTASLRLIEDELGESR